MASSKWKNFQEINEILIKKKLVLWGASNWVEPTLENISYKPEFIIDTNPSNHGINFQNLLVKPFNKKDLINKDYFIVICTGNYQTLADDLINQGFEMGEDFCVTPLLEERAKKDALMAFSEKILFTSPQHKFEEKSGGGVYLLDLNEKIEKKIYNGKCRSIVKFKNNYAVIDMLKGIVIFDKDYKVIKQIKLPKNCEPHGLFYDETNNLFFTGCPGQDCVLSVNLNGDIVYTFNISNKSKVNNSDNHHINDIFVKNDSLFVSMFSLTGNWTNECYDGGVVEFSISTGEKIGTLWGSLWMPHSITRHQSQLYILDSMTGTLKSSNNQINIKFPGFARGLSFCENFAGIGISSHRYPEKLKFTDYPALMNAGIFIVDLNTQMTVFYNIKQTETIHSLIFI